MPFSILILDYDSAIGQLLAEVLAAHGHSVCAIVATEDEAVEVAGRWFPDLVIADLRLDVGSGISALARIVRTRPVASVLISETPESIGRPVLQKPFREAVLLQAIDVAFAAHAEHQQQGDVRSLAVQPDAPVIPKLPRPAAACAGRHAARGSNAVSASRSGRIGWHLETVLGCGSANVRRRPMPDGCQCKHNGHYQQRP